MARKFPAMDQKIEPSDRKSLQSSSNDVRSRVRMLFGTDNAKAALLAVGIVVFFALALHHGEYRGEHQTSAPGCDGDSCGYAVANATPPSSNPEEIPAIRAVQNDSQYRPPGRRAKSN